MSHHGHIHGVDCACVGGGNGDGSLAPRLGVSGPPSAKRAEVPPAPRPAFLSPFSQEQEDATRHILAQVHGDVGISRSALTMVMRMQDCLAHALLSRAYAGQNPATLPCRSAEDQALSRASSIETDYPELFAAQAADPTHAIHFALPEGLAAAVGALAEHAQSEQYKALEKFAKGEAPPLDAAGPEVFQFGGHLGKRWFGDFVRGLEQGPDAARLMAEARRRQQEKDELMEKRTGKKKKQAAKSKASEAAGAEDAEASADAAASSSDAAGSSASAAAVAAPSEESKQAAPFDLKTSLTLLPEVLQHEVERVSLTSVIEYLTAELIELSGNRALDCAQQSIQLADVFCTVAQDEELRALVRWLDPNWHVCSAGTQEAALALAVPAIEHAPAQSWGVPRVSFLLDELFEKSIEAQDALAKSCWFHDAAKLDSYARRFAHGELRQSPLDRHLSALHVRPLQFYGAHQHTLLSDKADPEADPYHIDPRAAFLFLRFSVADGAGREWQFLLELTPHSQWKGCVSELDYCGGNVGFLGRRLRAGEDALRIDLAACHQIGDDEGRSFKPHTSDVSALEEEIVKTVAELKRRLDEHRASSMAAGAAKGSAGASAVSSSAAAAFSAAAASFSPATATFSPFPELGAISSASVDPVGALSAALGGVGLEERKESDAASASAAAASASASAAPAPAASAAASSSSASAVAAPAAGEFDPLSIFAPAPAAGKAKGAPRLTNRSGAKSAAAAAAAASAAAAAAAPFRPPTVQLGSQQALASLSALLGGISAHSARSQVQRELESVVAGILPLALFSRWGPSLYVHNQPELLRRSFTVALLDEAMSQPPEGSAAPLPQLPIVLLDLIAQFHSFDLPFLEDEAATQLAAQKWLPQAATRLMYNGQSNNPVEKLGQLQHDADEILPPIDVMGQGDEGEDDEGEDEDGEDGEDDDDDDGFHGTTESDDPNFDPRFL